MFSLPLSDEDLISYINDTSKFYDIKYSAELKENAIVYLSNLNIKCNLNFDSTLDKQQFIQEYMKSMSLCSINNIELDVIYIILRSVFINLEGFNVDIDQKFADSFIEQNQELIKHYQNFLDSLIFYALACIVKDKTMKFNESIFKNSKEIDDKNYIGLNIVKLLSHDEIYFYYIKRRINSLFYFKEQFTSYMFNGMNLFYYFNNSIINKLAALISMNCVK